MTKSDSLLWEIRKQNKFKGYLFGTMHVSEKIAFSNFDPIYKAMDQCDTFAAEILMDNDSQREMGKHMNLPEHVSISKLISAKKYIKLKKLLKQSYKLNMDQFERLLPLFLINYMTQLSFQATPQQMNESMDMQCWNYAKQQSIKLDALEDINDHINTLYEIPLDFQIQALKSALRNVSKFRKNSKKMLELYKQQRIHELYAKSKKSLGGIKEVLLYKRNNIMVENILRITQDSSCFCALGAGHLSGKKGVIHILKQNGFSVKASRFSNKLDELSNGH